MLGRLDGTRPPRALPRPNGAASAQPLVWEGGDGVGGLRSGRRASGGGFKIFLLRT